MVVRLRYLNAKVELPNNALMQQSRTLLVVSYPIFLFSPSIYRQLSWVVALLLLFYADKVWIINTLNQDCIVE
jgi:hypothetical protein